MHITDSDRWNVLLEKAQEAQIILAFENFRRNAIEPVLIKGWAAATNYPGHVRRRTGDIDLAVAPHDYERALNLIRTPLFDGHFIDLHNGLSQLDTVGWKTLYSNSILKTVENKQVRVLSDEDHLRLLCIHWLIDGGRFKDKLWDIYYAVENRNSNFDWSRCLDVVSPIRRRWVTCAIGIAHIYLGLDIGGLPFEAEAIKIPKWIKRCIENEWKQSYNFEPILTSTHDMRLFAHQIFRRIPPNPIRATIESEGDLYSNRRPIYQAKVFARRLGPFLQDSLHLMKVKMRGNIS